MTGIVAINRLSNEYFEGAREEHTGFLFVQTVGGNGNRCPCISLRQSRLARKKENVKRSGGRTRVSGFGRKNATIKGHLSLVPLVHKAYMTLPFVVAGEFGRTVQVRALERAFSSVRAEMTSLEIQGQTELAMFTSYWHFTNMVLQSRKSPLAVGVRAFKSFSVLFISHSETGR
jgi:hypothetical protein